MDKPVETNIITIVLLPYDLPHFFQQLNGCVVEIHEVPTHECHTYQSKRKYLFFLSCTIPKAAVLRILEVSDCIGDDGADGADCMFLPYLEPSFEFLAIDHYVVIHIEEDCLLAFLGDLVTPIHGIGGSLVEIDCSFPGVSF